MENPDYVPSTACILLGYMMLHFGPLSSIGFCPVCTPYLWLEGELVLFQVDPKGRVAPCLLSAHLAGCPGPPLSTAGDADRGTVGPCTHCRGGQPHI